MVGITNKPSVVKWQKYCFLIMDAPNDANLHLYLKEMKKQRVTDLVRACEPTYTKEQAESAGFRVHELEFQDGESPTSEIIDTWLDLVERVFKNNHNATINENDANNSIAVHCVAGLGRAPVLVAIALIENGFDPINAVEHIRKFRRGAINLRQLKYLEKYEPRRKAKNSCSIM